MKCSGGKALGNSTFHLSHLTFHGFWERCENDAGRIFQHPASMICDEGIMVSFFTNRCGRPVAGQQTIVRRQPKDLSPDRLQMSAMQRGRIRPANRPRKQRIADKADALRVSIDTIADPARGMARRSEAMDAETPDRNPLTLFRRLELCRRGPRPSI